ncbi:hypothetical protein BDE02_12G032500 [Populus trichocarpa]|nr:hypothetical protein BDE02_12G032500 [Populus trichocarpa]
MKVLEQILAHAIQLGYEQSLFVAGKIIVFCAAAEHGDMSYAVSVFEKTENPDAFIWNTMIRGFGKTNDAPKAFEFYKRMQERGLVADDFTFSFLLKIFPALVAWNTMIGSYVSCGKFKEALGMFSRMMELGVEPDEATLVETFSAGSSLGALDFGRWDHSCISNTDHGSIIEVNYSLINMYAKCGALEEAYETFDGMSKKNTVTWNTMILVLAVMALQMMHWFSFPC